MEFAAITRTLLIDADGVPPVSDRQRAGAPSFLRRLEAATERIKHLDTENTRLREALAHALGDQRAKAVRGDSPTRPKRNLLRSSAPADPSVEHTVLNT